MSIWYELNEKNNGNPVCYFKEEKDAQEFQKNYLRFSILEKIKNPSHLEFIVKSKEKIFASFEFEPHAINYNQIFFKGKGTIEPNPK